MLRITNNETGSIETVEYFYQVQDLCKMLSLKTGDGKQIGRNRMFKVLRYNGVLCNDNSPKQSLLNLGLAIYHRTLKRYKSYGVTMFSEKGINYLQRQFETGKFIVFYESTIRKKRIKNIDEVC